MDSEMNNQCASPVKTSANLIVSPFKLNNNPPPNTNPTNVVSAGTAINVKPENTTTDESITKPTTNSEIPLNIVQTILDENSSLVVEIMTLHDAIKNKQFSNNSNELAAKVDTKKRQLNKNLMILAKWADEETAGSNVTRQKAVETPTENVNANVTETTSPKKEAIKTENAKFDPVTDGHSHVKLEHDEDDSTQDLDELMDELDSGNSKEFDQNTNIPISHSTIP